MYEAVLMGKSTHSQVGVSLFNSKVAIFEDSKGLWSTADCDWNLSGWSHPLLISHSVAGQKNGKSRDP